MILVVDANIVFSAVLSKNGVVAETFREAQGVVKLIAPAYLADELVRLRPKMAKSAKKTLAETESAQRWALAQIDLVAEEMIARKHWLKAVQLTAHVDPDDIPYVALALARKCALWTGDKQLREGLALSGFSKTLTTVDVRKLLPFG